MESNIVSTDKGHVVEHVATLAGVLEGTTVVRLDMKELGEKRFRLRTGGGSEARVTEAVNRHCQETRNHRARGLYQVDKGWVACVTGAHDDLVVDMAFANDDNFVVDVPKGVDYVIVMSGPATYAYMTNDKKASKPKKDDLYTRVAALTDDEIFRLYAKRTSISYFDIEKMVAKSFESFTA